jgi:hypothetical protein
MARAILGSCVVLPEPVSPQTITTWCAAMAAMISSRLPETGRDSGKVMLREGKARALKARDYRLWTASSGGNSAICPAAWSYQAMRLG